MNVINENFEQKIKSSRDKKSYTSPKNQKIEEIKEIIIESLNKDKAIDISLIDLKGKTDIADYMIVATGNVNKHIAAMADRLTDKLEMAGYYGIVPEGDPKSEWILIDAYDIIVHLFTEKTRQEYKLEELWNFSNKNKKQ